MNKTLKERVRENLEADKKRTDQNIKEYLAHAKEENCKADIREKNSETFLNIVRTAALVVVGGFALKTIKEAL